MYSLNAANATSGSLLGHRWTARNDRPWKKRLPGRRRHGFRSSLVLCRSPTPRAGAEKGSGVVLIFGLDGIRSPGPRQDCEARFEAQSQPLKRLSTVFLPQGPIRRRLARLCRWAGRAWVELAPAERVTRCGSRLARVPRRTPKDGTLGVDKFLCAVDAGRQPAPSEKIQGGGAALA
jgi:hypothetical protein